MPLCITLTNHKHHLRPTSVLCVCVHRTPAQACSYSHCPKTCLVASVPAPADATGARSLLARTSSTASGVCAVQATLSLPGSPPLTALNFTRVVGLAALSVYAYPGLVAAAPSLDAAEQRGLVLAGGAGVRLLKCDFANYEQVSFCFS